MSIDFKGLAEVIKTCARSKVSKLKVGDVEVLFSDDTMKQWKEWTKPAKQSAEVHGDGENRVEFVARDDSQLLLEDPLAFERMQLEG